MWLIIVALGFSFVWSYRYRSPVTAPSFPSAKTSATWEDSRQEEMSVKPEQLWNILKEEAFLGYSAPFT